MKKIVSTVCALFIFGCLFCTLNAVGPLFDPNDELPEILPPEAEMFQKIPNAAQYGKANWDNVVGVSKGITLSEAYKIAHDHEEITFFFYTKGWQMVLISAEGEYRIFNHGDTVFFSGTPWWGSAPALADGFVKIKQ